MVEKDFYFKLYKQLIFLVINGKISFIICYFGGKMFYNKKSSLDTNDKQTLLTTFNNLLNNIKHTSLDKALKYITNLPLICKMHYNSLENREQKRKHSKKLHPIIPKRGEIYNAYITEGVGSELCDNHLVLILQNNKGNMYGEKVNIVPIEGDGTKINPAYQVKLSNDDMENGYLTKDPSRIIVTDITTIDKARLGKRIGKVKAECMSNVDKILRQQLSL